MRLIPILVRRNLPLKKIVFLMVGLSFILFKDVNAQLVEDKYYDPKVAIKTNLLYWGTTTPNLSFEFGLGDKTTLDVLGNYNFWEFSNDKKLKHWLVQPEFRFWTCQRFSGHFFGIHGHYAEYNVGGIKALGLKNRRYQGNLYGAGISYGYQWLIGARWSMEATIGVGYAHLDYKKYECGDCGQFLGKHKHDYFGPTRAGLSFIYFFK